MQYLTTKLKAIVLPLLLLLAASCSGEDLQRYLLGLQVSAENMPNEGRHAFHRAYENLALAPAADDGVWCATVRARGAAEGGNELCADGATTVADLRTIGECVDVDLDWNRDQVVDAATAVCVDDLVPAVRTGTVTERVEFVVPGHGVAVQGMQPPRVNVSPKVARHGDVISIDWSGAFAAESELRWRLWQRRDMGWLYWESEPVLVVGEAAGAVTFVVQPEWPATNSRTGSAYAVLPLVNGVELGGTSLVVLGDAAALPGPSGASVILDDGAATTTDASVAAALVVQDARWYRLHTDRTLLAGAPWQPLVDIVDVVLPAPGDNTVYAQYADRIGNLSLVVSDAIRWIAEDDDGSGGGGGGGAAAPPTISEPTQIGGDQLALWTRQGATCRWDLVDGPILTMSGSCSSGPRSTCDLGAMSEGTGWVWIRCADGAAETAGLPVLVDIDRTAPSVLLMTPSSPARTTAATLTVEVALDEAGACRFSHSDGAYSAMTLPCDDAAGSWARCDFTGLLEGTGSVYLACTDRWGNANGAGEAAVWQYDRDSSPPSVVSVSPPTGGASRAAALELTLSLSEPGSCRWGHSSAAYTDLGGACAGSGASVVCALAGLSEGERTIHVSCRDDLGNESVDALVWTVHIDRTGPAVLGVSPAAGIYPLATTAALTLDESGECRFGPTAAPWTALPWSCSSSDSTAHCDLSVAGSGSVSLVAACRDALGNEGPIASLGSWTLTVPPAAPSGLTAEVLPSLDVSLTWPAVDGVTAWRIERSINGGAWELQVEITGGETGWTDELRQSGVVAQYRLIAIAAGGASPPGDVIEVTLPTVESPPPAPVGVVAVPGDGRVEISWQPSAGAVSYKIYYDSDAGSPYAGAGAAPGDSPIFANSTSLVLSDLGNGMPLWVAVRAVGPTGLESGYSSEIRVVPHPMVAEGGTSTGPGAAALGRDSRGWLYVASQEGHYTPGAKLRVYRSKDEGRTWHAIDGGGLGSPIAGSTTVISLAVDHDDRVYVAWSWREIPESWDVMKLLYASWDGEQWSGPSLIGVLEDSQYLGRLLVDRRNRLHIVINVSDRIYYSRCDSLCWLGGTWTPWALVHQGAPVGLPVLAFDSQDRLHLVWSGLDPANPPGVFNRTVRYTSCAGACTSTGEWQTPYDPIGLAGYSQTHPDLTIDGADRVHLMWSGTDAAYADLQIRHRSCLWPCRAAPDWSATTLVTMRAGYGQGNPLPAIGADGRLHVVWRGGSSAYPRVNVWSSSCGLPCAAGASWSTPARRSDVASSGAESQVALADLRSHRHADRDGAIDYLWQGIRDVGTHRLYYGRLDAVAPPRAARTTVPASTSNFWQLDTSRRLVTTSDLQVFLAYAGGVSRSTDNGETWVATAVPHTDMQYPYLALGASSSVHLTYARNGVGTLYYTGWTGSAWTTPVALTTAISTRRHVMQIDASGRLHVFFHSTSGAQYRTCASGCETAANWSAVRTVGASATGAVDMVLDDAGVLHTAWEQAGGMRYSRCASACQNANWSAAITPRSRAETLAEPRLGLDAGGGLLLAFRISQTGNPTNGLYMTRCAATCTSAVNWQAEFALTPQSTEQNISHAAFARSIDGTIYLAYREAGAVRLLMCHDGCGPNDWRDAGGYSVQTSQTAPSLVWSTNHTPAGPLTIAWAEYWNGDLRWRLDRDPWVTIGPLAGGPPSVPAAVSGLVLAPDLGQLRLTWADNANNETFQRIERQTNGGTWAALVVLGAGVTTYTDSWLSETSVYGYRVVAGNSAGEAPPSAVASGSPSATVPAGVVSLTATKLGASSIRLFWTDNASNETGFKIERSPNGSSSWTNIATAAANATQYDDTGLAASTTYYYRVKATNSAGDASPSPVAQATTDALAQPPSAPSSLIATAENPFRIRLNWADNANNETGFKIERSPNGSSSWTQIATVGANTTQYLNSGLSESTSYYYRVRAYNGQGDSTYTNTANAATPSMTLMYFQDFEYSGLFNDTIIGNQQWNDGTDYWATGDAGRIRWATTAPYVYAGSRALWFSALAACGTADCNQIMVYRSAASTETVRVRVYVYNPNASNVTIQFQRAGGTAVQRTVTPGSYQLITADLDSTMSTGAVMVHLGLIPNGQHLNIDNLRMDRFTK